MKRAFNKYGNIEIEASILKYRITSKDLGVEDPIELEKEIKRKLLSLNNPEYLIVPMSVEAVNRYMILFYDMTHYSSFDHLKELELEEKIPYLLSLVNIARQQEDEVVVYWDRLNFVCDAYERIVKVFLYETGALKVYEHPENLLKEVQDMICSTMTTLKSFTVLPRREHFFNPTSENIAFVESVYRMENLDDLYMYLETTLLDLEQSRSDDFESHTESTAKPKRRFFGTKDNLSSESEVEAKVVKTKRIKVAPKRRESSPKKKKNNTAKWSLIAVGIAIPFYIINMMLLPSADTAEQSVTIPVLATNEEGYFQGGNSESPELVEAYRKAYNSDYSAAHSILAQMPKTDLHAQDVPLLIRVYEETGNLAPLLDEVPTIANDVVTYLLTNNKLDRLTDISGLMVTKNPYIEFEKAHFNQEYEYMLSLIDKVDINGRKESQIIDGYLNLDMPMEARRFAESVGNPDLIKRVEEYKK